MANYSVAGLKKDSKEHLLNLGKNLAEVVNEQVAATTKVAALVEGKDENNLTKGTVQNLSAISEIVTAILTGVKEVAETTMKELKEAGERVGSDGTVDTATEIAQKFAAIEAKKFVEPQLTKGGDSLTNNDQNALVDQMKTLIDNVCNSISSLKASFQAVIDSDEQYSDAFLSAWNNLKAPHEALQEFRDEYKKNTNATMENVKQLISRQTAKAGEDIESSKTKIGGLKDAASSDYKSAVEGMV